MGARNMERGRKANAQFWKSKIEANRARDRDTDALLNAKGGPS